MFDGLCEIRRAGVTPEGFAQLDLRAADGSWSWTWFRSNPALSREILAVALAAITADKLVDCVIDDPTVSWSEVSRFLIVK